MSAKGPIATGIPKVSGSQLQLLYHKNWLFDDLGTMIASTDLWACKIAHKTHSVEFFGHTAIGHKLTNNDAHKMVTETISRNQSPSNIIF